MQAAGGGGSVINAKGATSNSLSVQIADSEKMRIDSSGNLLVGHTSAEGDSSGTTLYQNGQTVHKADGSYALELVRSTSDGEIVRFRKDGAPVGSIGTAFGELTIGNGGSGLMFVDTGQDRVLPSTSTGAAADGLIDLGDNNDRFKDLYLSGGVLTSTVKFLANTTVSGSDATIFRPADNTMAFSTNGAERMRIDSSGNLLVGATSPPSSSVTGWRVVSSSYPYVQNSVADSAFRYAYEFINSNGTVGTISTAGSTTSYNTSSDQRLKDNIADADDAGSKIDAIQVRQYDWKADGSHQDYGMIAQELQLVAPEAVSGDADSEEMMGVDYSKLVPMLIKEIQSLRNRVAQLEA